MKGPRSTDGDQAHVEPPRAGSGRSAPPAPGRAESAYGRGTSAARGVAAGWARLVPVDTEPHPADALARSRAGKIASRLAVRRPRLDSAARRGSGTLASFPYRGGSDDVDLDATLEVLAERPVPEDEDIVVRERAHARRSVVLAVDVSGSMRGERIQTAAATVGALAGALKRDDLGVIAFWSDAAILLPLGGEVKPLALLDTMLGISARGMTNVSFPLEVAARQLSRVPARDARVVLLSDCVHNEGPDPRIAAARLPRLDVIVDTSAEHDLVLARDLARAGRGTAHAAHSYRDIAPAVSAIFGG